jgi:hypothetical protein
VGVFLNWPIFGIANQLLAATALCLATTIILKMALGGNAASTAPSRRSPALALVTLVPLLWLLTVTGTASVQKIWHPDARIGFHAAANAAEAKREELRASGTASAQQLSQVSRQIFNARLDAWVTLLFLALVASIFVISAFEWIQLLRRARTPELSETEPRWLPAYALTEGPSLKMLGWMSLAVALLRELSGEAAVDRAANKSLACQCQTPVNLLREARPGKELTRGEAYQQAVLHRYDGRVDRCC